MKSQRLKNNENLQGSIFSLSAEGGSAAFFGLVGLACIALFIKYSPEYLPELPAPIYMGILSVLVVVTLFSMGCAIHLRALGDKPRRKLIGEIQTLLCEYENLLSSTNDRIRELEQSMISKMGAISRRGADCFGLLKKLVRAVEKRNYEVTRLVSSGQKADLFDAYDVLNRRLVVSESAIESLIDSDPVPALENIEIRPSIERLLSEIEFEIRRAA